MERGVLIGLKEIEYLHKKADYITELEDMIGILKDEESVGDFDKSVVSIGELENQKK